ncbi:trypsin alpha-like [Drosophila ficusphila]|uniref:trypsin alpha-like n=1 Tax=Drosophila ficusphila TaxID=30025 RepID=UPI0007E73E2B|nr:trypsin alpha-like [Drosophila ficusphila]
MFVKCFLLLLAINFLSAGRAPQPEERIIGGKDVEIEEAPWQVSIQFREQHYCGGSIYSKDIIITAAHCRFNETGEERLEPKHFQVRVGSALKNSKGTLIKVKAIISHEKYNNPKFANDIAVMRLSEPLEFSSKVQAIPLAKRNPSRGTLAITTGWGAWKVIPFGEEYAIKLYPEQLQSAHLNIQNCLQYRNTTDDNVCGHSFEQSACSADSGGPLVVDHQLVGVTSFAPAFCDGFAAFAGIPSFRNWILNATKFI